MKMGNYTSTLVLDRLAGRITYKFKVGEKVRIKPSMDLGRIGIGGKGKVAELTSSELTIEATPETDTLWYGIDGWRIPESFLKRVVNK